MSLDGYATKWVSSQITQDDESFSGADPQVRFDSNGQGNIPLGHLGNSGITLIFQPQAQIESDTQQVFFNVLPSPEGMDAIAQNLVGVTTGFSEGNFFVESEVPFIMKGNMVEALGFHIDHTHQ